MAGVAAANGFPVLNLQAYLEGKTVLETRALVADLCRQFYTLGWVSGTGGSITIKVHDDSIPKPDQLIVMSPSGVQKERMISEDMYVLSSGGEVLSKPCPKSYPHKTPKCSDCAPLFMKAYQMCNAGAVIHSHGMESCLVTMINPLSNEFRIAHMEMIKGIFGHGYYDELVIPIIENTAYERELTKSLSEAISAYPKTTAVLVRNHGIYVWGDSWISAKTQKCIVLDIEGTTTPISFVTEILFPYARDNVRKHLISTYDTIETKDDIELLRAQVLDDLEKGILGCTPIPPDDAGKEEVIESLVVNVEAMIKADRKITALKQLQGHIWRTGYDNNELQGVVFNDVPEALERWHDGGIKIYIYSSGSREAQRLIFRNTVHGDLRKYLCGFFDTTIGNKRDAKSYCEISQSVGVDKPSEILFITDVYQEAVAAKAAGLEAIISIRPGNAPLSENHEFKTITSFAEI
ncbi:probable bifunctional methylthioribulose-1-phosphate dehydratase/enolase-phosphatase E1 isoform X3 [Phalaenopsis equestris]|uniref:probable bifunctional methylthioribulose-1-phosphate dehydratase/enolase-phosphatase E1 isoform X3 n=1 Tax=Phalaenopsis equestris TaxID=78828 RepID=UPI0009E34C9B|nr:probable bifunctional methylthioribulose-1-phosphate dehydratase/enolase-phosphatase E1 isoform X3 [Phalaenopsis equestris]